MYKPAKAAIFLREQDLTEQKNLVAAVMADGFIFTKAYIVSEPDHTAIQELLKDANKQLFDCVFVPSLSALGRSLNSLLEVLSEFNRLNIELVSLEESVDTRKQDGSALYEMASIFREFDKKTRVKHIKAGLLKAVENGQQLGRPPKNPDAVENVISLRNDGLSLREIAKRVDMSAAGVFKILRRGSGSFESKPSSADIWQLKIYLTLIKPQIWRRVLVPSDITLEKLSATIEKLFDWRDELPHEFVPRDSRGFGYSLKCDEKTFRLCDVKLKPGDGMLFEYCYDWTHEVTFEKIVPREESQSYPVCSGGSMANPPEECSGAMEYIEAFRKKKTLHFRSAWSKNFDRQRFDLAEINSRLGVKFLGKETSATKSRKASAPEPPVYQFRIKVCSVSPEIWRRVLVKEATTLSQLSRIIDTLFDWSGDHLHRFSFSTPFGPGGELSNEEQSLAGLGLEPGDVLIYEYDFGDCWVHEIVLEEVSPASKRRTYPICLAGRNAGPPEDCGGPYMFMNDRNFLSRRRGNRGKAPRGQVSWSQKEFYKENYRSYDPDQFDKESVNKELQKLFPEEKTAPK